MTEPNGGVTLLNKSGGRAAAIWTGNATVGQGVGQWADNSATGSWNLIKTGHGFYKLQSVKKHEPVPDRCVRRGAVDAPERDDGRLAGLEARPIGSGP